MNILAFDLGTATGWAVAQDTKVVKAETLVLATPKEVSNLSKRRLDRRCDPRPARLKDFVTARIAEFKPDLVVFEDVEFSTYRKQDQLWSSLRTALWLSVPDGVKLDCVNVTKLKTFATGIPHARKEDMVIALIEQVPDQFRLIEFDHNLLALHITTGRVLDDNAVDAVQLARWARSTYR